MHIGTKIYTWIMGNFVGKDNFGNKYYSNSKNTKRWVIYNNDVEASKVPSHWHAWLHKMTDQPPLNYSHKYPWQKDHRSNKTGTKEAYYPDSHPMSGSNNKFIPKQDYESWKPK